MFDRELLQPALLNEYLVERIHGGLMVLLCGRDIVHKYLLLSTKTHFQTSKCSFGIRCDYS